MGAVFALARFSLVNIFIRDLVADGKSLARNSGVGGGGQNLILRLQKPNSETQENYTISFALRSDECNHISCSTLEQKAKQTVIISEATNSAQMSKLQAE